MTTDAADRIALRWEPGAAVTSGPLMTHPDYTRYVREDATFTADDLCRAFAIAVEMAETICLQEHTSWPSRATDYACGASDTAGRLKNTIRALTPPDDLPARVKEGRDG